LIARAAQPARQAVHESRSTVMEKLLALLMAASEAVWLIAIAVAGWWALRAIF
jgi:hypothetical protein